MKKSYSPGSVVLKSRGCAAASGGRGVTAHYGPSRSGSTPGRCAAGSVWRDADPEAKRMILLEKENTRLKQIVKADLELDKIDLKKLTRGKY